MEEIAGMWRKRRYIEFHNMYSSPTSVRIRWARRVARMENMRNVYKRVAGIRIVKTPDGRPTIKYVTEMGSDTNKSEW